MDDPTEQMDGGENAGEEPGVENPTVPLVRELQDGGSETEWTALSDKVDAFLRRAHGHGNLPNGVEFADFRQFVFVRLLAAIPTLELTSRREFWGYVKRLADNAKTDLWRRARTEKHNAGREPTQQFSPDGADRLARQGEVAGSPSAHARSAELEERELECVKRLTNDEAREVYLLRRREGKSYEEIAEIVGRKRAGTVKVIFHRAQKSVTKCLRGRLDGYTVFFDGLT